MEAMDAKRPFGRVAVVLAAMLAFAGGWKTLATAAQDREPKHVDDSVVVMEWDVANVLCDIGVLEIVEIGEDGSAVATFAASTGTGPSVIIQVGSVDVIAQAAPPKWPALPPGYFPTGGRWDRPWTLQGCISVGEGDVRKFCRYTKTWTVYTDVPCSPGGPSVRHFYRFTLECLVQTDDCNCPAQPGATDCATPVTGWQGCLPAGGGPVVCIPNPPGFTIEHWTGGQCP